MIPYDFSYLRPATFQEAVEAFQEFSSAGKQALYYGGGSEILSKSRAGAIHPDAVIDFREAADPTSDVNVRYLRNLGGAFGAIYASQMQEMGLIKLDDRDLPVPFCKDPGVTLAESFQSSIGDLTEVFLDAVDAGEVRNDRASHNWRMQERTIPH